MSVSIRESDAPAGDLETKEEEEGLGSHHLHKSTSQTVT